MKLLKRITLTLIAVTLFFSSGKAQTLSLEKTYEITGKANRGYLGNINIDEASNLIELTYVKKQMIQKQNLKLISSIQNLIL